VVKHRAAVTGLLHVFTLDKLEVEKWDVGVLISGTALLLLVHIVVYYIYYH
jgi:hypothetical protein